MIVVEKERMIELRFYYPYEIAAIYGIDKRTMYKRLKKIRKKLKLEGKMYSIEQAALIFEHLKIPGVKIIIVSKEAETVIMNNEKDGVIPLNTSNNAA